MARHGGLDAALPGQKDNGGEGSFLAQRLEESVAVEAGHDEVGDDHGRQARDGLFEGFLPVGGLLDGVAPAGEEGHEPLPRGGLVIDYQYLEAHADRFRLQWYGDPPGVQSNRLHRLCQGRMAVKCALEQRETTSDVE